MRTHSEIKTEQEAKLFLNKLQRKYSQESVHITKEGILFSVSKDGILTAIRKDGGALKKFSMKSSFAKSILKDYIVTKNGVLRVRPLKILKILSDEGGTTDPAPGRYEELKNSKMTVKAIPDVKFGYRFSHWKGPGNMINKDNPVSFTIETNGWIQAVFKKR
jgi:hypothetical protein